MNQLNSYNLIGNKLACYEKATTYDSGTNSLSDNRLCSPLSEFSPGCVRSTDDWMCTQTKGQDSRQD